MKNLEELRKEIDEIDSELVMLFERRMDVVREVGAYKRAHRLAVYDEKRVEKVLEKVTSKLRDGSHALALEKVYRALMDVSKEAQR